MAISPDSELTLRELFRGKRAHVDPVACVEGLTLKLAIQHLAGFPHSIWQLVFHMNYWMGYELKRIRGERPAYPTHADGSWPAAPVPANETEWQQATADFRTLVEDLSALAEGRDLDRAVDVMQPSQEQRAYSVRDVLWQTMVHNSYHIGQIAMLRRMLGVWPPRGGGDNW